MRCINFGGGGQFRGPPARHWRSTSWLTRARRWRQMNTMMVATAFTLGSAPTGHGDHQRHGIEPRPERKADSTTSSERKGEGQPRGHQRLGDHRQRDQREHRQGGHRRSWPLPRAEGSDRAGGLDHHGGVAMPSSRWPEPDGEHAAFRKAQQPRTDTSISSSDRPTTTSGITSGALTMPLRTACGREAAVLDQREGGQRAQHHRPVAVSQRDRHGSAQALDDRVTRQRGVPLQREAFARRWASASR